MEGKIFESIEELFQHISNYEIKTSSKFVCGSTTKGFGKTGLTNVCHKKIFWEDQSPYIKLGKKLMYCHFGKDQHQRRKERNRAASKYDHDYGKNKKRFRLHDSKKLGCPAKLIINELMMFPSYKTSSVSKNEKDNLSKEIREKWESGVMSSKRLFKITTNGCDHENHPTGPDAEAFLPVDKDVVKKIYEMVDEGVTDAQEMRRHIKNYLPSITSSLPSATNSRFNPSIKTIKNHMYLATKKEHCKINEQEELKDYLNQWKEDNPEDLVYVRLKSDTEKLLVVIQTSWMQSLIRKYGKTVYLDATYNTSKFSLPLFFLAVKTNANFQITAAFILEDESSYSIKEALKIIQQNNRDWRPKYFITDLDEKEINAMASIFPESQNILCDFHRIQSWSRWLTKGTNQVKNKTETLKEMKDIADQLEEYNFNIKTEKFLKSHNIQDNVKNYFMRIWYPIKEKWAKCYRCSDVATANTNNGLERLHQTLKSNHLKGKKTMGISKMIKIVMTSFFQSLKNSYIEKNRAWAGACKKTNPEVPKFLHNRPPKFVMHCVERIELAAHIDHRAAKYNTDIESGQCSCPDFRRTCWPCKHMFAALNNEGSIDWERLPSAYRQSPYMNVDFQANGEENQPEEKVNLNDKIMDSDTKELGSNDKLPSLTCIQKQVRENLDLMRSKTYEITDKTILSEMNEELKKLLEKIPNTSFNISKPVQMSSRKPLSLSLRKKRKTKNMLNEDMEITTCTKSKDTLMPSMPENFDPLSNNFEQQCNQVRSSWSGQEVINLRLIGPYLLTNDSFKCIKDFLSDEVIDGFIFSLVKSEQKNRKCFHLNSIAMTSIIEGVKDIHSNLRRVSSLMSFDALIGAYNEGGFHWCLVIILPEEKKILYLNPLRKICANAKNIVVNWLNFIKNRFELGLEEKRPEMQWSIETPNHALQIDGRSCGVYVLKYVENFLLGKGFNFTWTDRDIEDIRFSLAVYLLSISTPRIPNLNVSDDKDVTVINSTTDKNKIPVQRNLRNILGKRKSSTFVYPSPKKSKMLYCVCRLPDTGSLYWQCCKCTDWFHPACIHRDQKDSPNPFYCDKCLHIHCKEFPIENVLSYMNDHDNKEIKFAVNLNTVLSKMHGAYMKCYKITSSSVYNSHLDWLKRHCTFIRNKGNVQGCPYGFGFHVYSQEAILTVERNLRNVFMKKKRLYSIEMELDGDNIGSTRLKRMVKNDIEIGEKYINTVLLKEALIDILIQVSGMPYQQADTLLQKTEGKTLKKCIVAGLKLRSEVKI